MTYDTYMKNIQESLGALQLLPNDVLAAVARGELDLNLFAVKELSSRGYNDRGEWVGFRG